MQTPVSPITEWDAQASQGLDSWVNMFAMDPQMLGEVEAPPHEQGIEMGLARVSKDPQMLGEVEASPHEQGTGMGLASVSNNAPSEFVQSPPSRYIFTLMSPSLQLDNYHCYQIMLGLLEGLNQLNPECESARITMAPGESPNRQPASFSSNEVMKSNRAAFQDLNFLLSRRCRVTCLARLDSAYLLRSICLVILARYQNIFESLSQNPLQSIHQTPPFLHHGGANSAGSVFFDPIQLRDFPLDRQAEMRINAELLLCELRVFLSIAVGVDKIQMGYQQEQEREREREREERDSTGQHQGRQCSAQGSQLAFEELLREKVDRLRALTKDFRDRLM
ncbi:hypothetical protein MGN70_011996 [Eutypa lata]|nr:hypothetical protein MGN70_011996 [Eutypa lata]